MLIWFALPVMLGTWLILAAVNHSADVSHWSAGSRVVLASGLVTSVLVYGLRAGSRSRAKWALQHLDGSSALAGAIEVARERVEETAASTVRWVIVGVLLFGGVGYVAERDPVLGPVFGVGALLIAVFVGSSVGVGLSPYARANEALHDLEEIAARRSRESLEQKFQREQRARGQQATAMEWRQRVFDALIWWSSEGASLTTDSSYMLAFVRMRHQRGMSDPSNVIAQYQDPNDPCLTRERAAQVARWAIAQMPELVAEHVEESRRSIEGLTDILRHHQRREVSLYRELRAYALREAVEAQLDESPELLVERLLKQSDSVALAREKGLQRVQETAERLTGDARERYAKAATAAIDALLDAWLFARSRDVRHEG